MQPKRYAYKKRTKKNKRTRCPFLSAQIKSVQLHVVDSSLTQFRAATTDNLSQKTIRKISQKVS